MGSSISTTRGDNDVDELNSTLGFARSICEDTEIAELSK